MIILGIDLSGPANHADTTMVWFRGEDSRLHYMGHSSAVSDASIFIRIGALADRDYVIVGIDAPLSYNDGGGDRPGDASLRAAIVAIGMRSGSVMTPTATRMSYLTLRGLAVARGITLLPSASRVSVMETHPGAVFGLHGAPLATVMTYKDDPASRSSLIGWLGRQQVHGLPETLAHASHDTAACGAALGAWHWRRKTQRWLLPAAPPQHPYDYSC